jgi:hypothetical protein
MSDSNAINCRITLLHMRSVEPRTTIFGGKDLGEVLGRSNTTGNDQMQTTVDE